MFFYLDLSHSEAKRVGIPIEYISLNNSSYKYQACKVQYVNLYLKLGLLSHFETPITPVCVKAAPGWPKSEGGGVR